MLRTAVCANRVIVSAIDCRTSALRAVRMGALVVKLSDRKLFVLFQSGAA